MGPPPTRPRLRHEVTALASGRVLAALTSAVWLMVAARFLPVDAFGDLALLLAIGAIFGIATDLGLTIVLAQVVASDTTMGPGAVTLVVRRRLVAGVIACGGVALGYLVAATDSSPIIPLVFSASILATAVHTSLTAALRAAGRVGPEALNEVISRCGVLAVGSVWLSRGGGLLAAVIVYAVADVLSAIALSAVARRRLSGPAGPLDVSGHFGLRAVAPLAVFTLLTTVYYKVDVWILALLRDSATVAPYAAAYRILDGLLLPAGALAALVVPRMVQTHNDDRRRNAARLTLAAVAVVAPGAVVVALVARPLMVTLFGQPYASGGPVLVVLMASAVPGAAALVLSQAAALMARRRLAIVTVVALTANVVLNVALIPAYGAIGAAWAAVFSQVLLAVLLVVSLRQPSSAVASLPDHPQPVLAGREEGPHPSLR